jgi:hypothetical protein
MERINDKGEKSMQENLSDMVKSVATEEPITFHEDNLSMPEVQTEIPVETESPTTIPITSLSSWFDNNVENFPNIKKPNVAVQNVDLDEQLIMTVLISSEDGVEKRKLIVYDDAHLQPVLNLPAIDMQIYNNGFRIIYDIGNGIFIKSYGVRTGLISVFCNDIEDRLVPYKVVRIKKRDNEIVVTTQNSDEVRRKLSEQLDFEALQLRYKQSSKTEGFTTNGEAINWLLARQTDIEDIHHHLQIDNVIIETLE